MSITFILNNGERRIVPFSVGETVLSVALKNDIPIKCMCEGFGVCGGCHVIIETPELLPEISEKEDAGLDKARNVTINSRLACQIVLTNAMDGLIIRIP